MHSDLHSILGLLEHDKIPVSDLKADLSGCHQWLLPTRRSLEVVLVSSAQELPH